MMEGGKWEIRNAPSIDEAGAWLNVLFSERDRLFRSDQRNLLSEVANGEIVMHWEFRAGYWWAAGPGHKKNAPVTDSTGIFLSQVYERMRPYVETFVANKDTPPAAQWS